VLAKHSKSFSHCNFTEKRSLMKEEILHGGGGA